MKKTLIISGMFFLLSVYGFSQQGQLSKEEVYAGIELFPISCTAASENENLFLESAYNLNWGLMTGYRMFIKEDMYLQLDLKYQAVNYDLYYTMKNPDSSFYWDNGLQVESFTSDLLFNSVDLFGFSVMAGKTFFNRISFEGGFKYLTPFNSNDLALSGSSFVLSDTIMYEVIRSEGKINKNIFSLAFKMGVFGYSKCGNSFKLNLKFNYSFSNLIEGDVYTNKMPYDGKGSFSLKQDYFGIELVYSFGFAKGHNNKSEK